MPAYEVPTPKYLRVLNTLRERIEEGGYGPGSALPSESQLSAEFRVSRPTVLKALGILRQDGWIEWQKGLRGDYAHEWLTCRKPTEDEAKLLDIDPGDPVMNLVIAVHQANGEPLLASALVLPGNRHEIEDTYPLG